jgi:hypothetical protein
MARFFAATCRMETWEIMAPYSLDSAQTRSGLRECWKAWPGLIDGTRDALTRYTEPLTGSYYFVPSVESLRQLR